MDVENISQLLYTFQLVALFFQCLFFLASFSFWDFFKFLHFQKIFIIMVKLPCSKIVSGTNVVYCKIKIMYLNAHCLQLATE